MRSASSWSEVAAELRDVHLYVERAAVDELESQGITFSADDQAAIEDALASTNTPVYVAVLPGSVADAQASRELAAELGEGSYLVLFGNRQLSAGSTSFTGGDDLANQVFADAGGDLRAGTIEFIQTADEQAASGESFTPDGASGSGGGGLLALAILGAVGGGGFLIYRRNQRAREKVELEQVRTALDEDITAYGEQLTALDLDVQDTAAVPIEARRDYGLALDLYEKAKATADRAEKPGDLQPVTHSLAEGRWLLKTVDARMKGEPLPERRPPCFFDPRHGPSVEDVEWAPPGGVARQVPACAADAVRIKDGLDPDVRLVRADDGEQRPYWEAGPAYGAWAGGYYGGFLPGIMWGTLLGSSMGGWGAGGADAGAVDAGSGGDFGGGGWGGGDFGGGDFGGGDFGGGDFGGF